jgi:abhydrolase domain-containing protein 6
MLMRFLHRSIRAQYHSLGFESRTLRSGRSSIHYLVRARPGSRGTLVLVHGLGTSSSTWVRTLKHLQSPDTIIALDLPGFGFSTPNPGRGFSTLDEHVEALSELINAATRPPVTLIGQSLGGWISARYTARAPENVKHLILIDTAGVNYPGVEHQRDLFTLRSVKDTRRLLNNLWYRYPWYFKPFTGSIYRELLSRRMNDLVLSVEPADFLKEEFPRLTMPVSIIWGKHDGATRMDSIDVLRTSLPHATVHLIDHCGHVPQLERPEALAETLNKILEA